MLYIHSKVENLNYPSKKVSHTILSRTSRILVAISIMINRLTLCMASGSATSIRSAISLSVGNVRHFATNSWKQDSHRELLSKMLLNPFLLDNPILVAQKVFFLCFLILVLILDVKIKHVIFTVIRNLFYTLSSDESITVLRMPSIKALSTLRSSPFCCAEIRSSISLRLRVWPASHLHSLQPQLRNPTANWLFVCTYNSEMKTKLE